MPFHSNFDQFTIQGHLSFIHSFIFKISIFKTFKILCEDSPLREQHQIKLSQYFIGYVNSLLSATVANRCRVSLRLVFFVFQFRSVLSCAVIMKDSLFVERFNCL